LLGDLFGIDLRAHCQSWLLMVRRERVADLENIV
jgi:hypothetical protein